MRDIENFHASSTAFKIDLALDDLPSYPFFEPSPDGFGYPAQMRIAPSVAYMEAAYDDMRQGRLSTRPYLSIMSPTVVDSSLAPPGKHLLSIYGGHVPFDLSDGTRQARREEIFSTVCETLEAYVPGFEAKIIHSQVLTPKDFEDIYALPGGHPHHGEITLDQLFVRRPAAHYAGYRSPVPGLYIASASAHPGGGVSGIPGYNAARVILGDWRKTERPTIGSAVRRVVSPHLD